MHAKLSIFRHDCKEGVHKNLVYEKLAHQKSFRQNPDDIIWCLLIFPKLVLEMFATCLITPW